MHRDQPAPDPLDEDEQVAAALLGDHLAQQRAQHADLAAERITRSREAGARRLGGDRREPGLAEWRGFGAGRARDAGGHRGKDAVVRRACQPTLGYGSTARAPSRYLAATDFGSGGA
jgi:hypothetical protein